MQDADGPCGTIQARKEPSRHVLVQRGKENRIPSLTTPKLQQSVFSSVLNSYSRSVDEGISGMYNCTKCICSCSICTLNSLIYFPDTMMSKNINPSVAKPKQ